MTDKEKAWAQYKLDNCRNMIESCGIYYSETKEKVYLQIAKEAEQDAVYWQAILAGHTHDSASTMAYIK